MANNKEHKVLNVPDLRFPGFSGEWDLMKLSDFSNKITTKNKGNIIKNVLCNSASLGIVQQSDYFDREIANTENTDGYFVISKGDFVYNPRKSTSAPYGPVNIYEGINTGIISPLYLCFSVYNIHQKFLYYRFKSPVWYSYIYSYGDAGIRFDRVSIKDDVFFDMPIYRPSHDEQVKIAAFLQLLDKRIFTQIKVIDKLESLMKGLCNQLTNCVDGTPIALSCILQERNEKSTTNNQYEVLSSTVKGIFTQREYFSKDIASANNVGYKIVRLNDIVLSPQNLWMGNINYNDNFDIGIVSPSYKVYKINSSFDMTYIAYLLKSHRALYNYMMVSEQGASIVRRNLNIELFEQLIFKIPSLERQRKVGGLLSNMNKQLKLANEQLSMYEKQKQYLLQKMFI